MIEWNLLRNFKPIFHHSLSLSLQSWKCVRDSCSHRARKNPSPCMAKEDTNCYGFHWVMNLAVVSSWYDASSSGLSSNVLLLSSPSVNLAVVAAESFLYNTVHSLPVRGSPSMSQWASMHLLAWRYEDLIIFIWQKNVYAVDRYEERWKRFECSSLFQGLRENTAFL